MERRWRREKCARIGRTPERAVEVVEQRTTEPTREPGPWEIEDVADSRCADSGERVHCARHDAHRKLGERWSELCRIREDLTPGAGEPRGAARGGCRGDERSEPHLRAAFAQARRYPRDAAEELQAARDFEDEGVRPLDRDARCELRRPAGESEQRFGFFGRVARVNSELR